MILVNYVVTDIDEFNDIISGKRDFVLTVNNDPNVIGLDLGVGDLIHFDFGALVNKSNSDSYYVVSTKSPEDILFKIKYFDNKFNNGSLAIGFDKYKLVKDDKKEVTPKKFC